MRRSAELEREIDQARRELVDILRRAHAGELGAARAYNGHWRSLRKPAEIAEVQEIERDERRHRARVGEMLTELGVSPSRWRERLMWSIGTAIGWFCRIGGWFVPMYGAGCLERGNVGEYEEAARFAALSARFDWVPDLLHMAEAEWDHETYFREKVESHWLVHLVPRWEAPAPRAAIQESFDDFLRVRNRRACGVNGGAGSSERSESSRRAPTREMAFARIRQGPRPRTSLRSPLRCNHS